MGSILTNGVFLPAEGERNCYEGLAANWTALDRMIGGYNVHISNTTIHVTAEDKAAWNGKADASALTAHTDDTTIHVTAEDKQAWNGKQDALSQTQLDAVNSGIDSTKVQQIATNTSDISSLQSGKANDSNVVHKRGNETVGGVKTFTDSSVIKASSPKVFLITTDQTGNTPPSSNTSNSLRFGGETVNNFGGVQCELLTTGENRLTNYVKDITTAKTNTIQQKANSTTATTVFNADLIVPATDGITVLGNSSKRWSNVQTYKVNTLEPSSLSLPSGNASDVIDISSYLVNLDGTTNTYTAPANGWISISMINCSSIQAYINGLWGHQVIRPTVGGVRFFMPVLKNKTINILIFGGTIDNARFIPCQGNV